MQRFCGQCGAVRQGASQYCTQCGAPYPAPALCPTCGQPMPANTVTGSTSPPVISSGGLGNSGSLGTGVQPDPPSPASTAPEPRTGPDYRPGMDCGNCGYPLDGTVPCPHCGSRNVGVKYDGSMTT